MPVIGCAKNSNDDSRIVPRTPEGSPDIGSSNYQQARIGDMTIGACGHTGTIISGSNTVMGNSLGKAVVGSSVTGCNIGTVVQGDVTHDIGL